MVTRPTHFFVSPVSHPVGTVLYAEGVPVIVRASTRADLIACLRRELHHHVPGDGFLEDHVRLDRYGRHKPVLNDVQVLRAALDRWQLASRRPSPGRAELTAW